MAPTRSFSRAIAFLLTLVSVVVLSPVGMPSAAAGARMTITVTKTGSGKVTSDPTGLKCGEAKATCSAAFRIGKSVKLEATPSDGWAFDGWTGCSAVIERVCKVKTGAGDKSVSVAFVQLYKLTVAVKGPGKVSSDPAGISCGSDCGQKFRDGTLVSLDAKAGDGAILKEWGGACAGQATGTACVLDMQAPAEADALFVRATGTATGTAIAD
jgi:hypothetical protein